MDKTRGGSPQGVVAALLRTFKAAGIAVLLAGFNIACSPANPPSASPPDRSEVRHGLTFEERMAVRADLSEAKAEAKRRAEEKYPPFQSQESADKNREYREQLDAEAERLIREKYGLSEADLAAIIDEYLRSQGVRPQ